MRRLGQWLFSGSAALSLLLCVGSAAFGIHSVFYDSWCSYNSPRDTGGNWRDWTIASCHGRICVWKCDLSLRASPGSFGFSGGVDHPPTPRDWPWLAGPAKPEGNGYVEGHGYGIAGFYWCRAVFFGPQIDYTYAVPDWFLCVLFFLLPVRWIRKHRRRGPGCCRVCGYDLRATPERCPECGTVATN
jgi:hypothetical protein